jgi:AcrR family transcriptional regulator
MRADAQRNREAVLEAAKAVFDESGVDAPAKAIAARAAVGVGTIYRHFPQRSDLVVAVLEREIDACARAGPELSAQHAPVEALEAWLARYTDLLATKHGLASALHSGDSALGAYFWERVGPALQALLDDATKIGELRDDVSADDLLRAVAYLCMAGIDYGRRMVAVLLDGLRTSRAPSRRPPSSSAAATPGSAP